MSTSVRIALVLALSSAAIACSDGPSKPPPKSGNDMVAANSVSEERLKGNEQPGAPKPVAQKEDPTQAATTSMSGAPSDSRSGKEKDDKPPASSKDAGGKVGQAECERIWDKGLELEIASNPALQDVDPGQLRQMAKQMAKDKHGAAPCDATPKQYKCAMSATSTARWKSCLK